MALEIDMRTVKEGVSNFRSFQQKLSTFVDTHEARETEREKIDRRRARLHFMLLGGLITIVTGCAIAMFTWVLGGHHTVSDLNRVSTSQPQDAANPHITAMATTGR